MKGDMSLDEAQAEVKGRRCPVCDSPYLLPIIRPPLPVFKAHCNHCGSEVPIVVLANREAWRFYDL